MKITTTVVIEDKLLEHDVKLEIDVPDAFESMRLRRMTLHRLNLYRLLEKHEELLESKFEEVPLVDDETGEILTDEETGKELTKTAPIDGQENEISLLLDEGEDYHDKIEESLEDLLLKSCRFVSTIKAKKDGKDVEFNDKPWQDLNEAEKYKVAKHFIGLFTGPVFDAIARGAQAELLEK